MKRFNSRGAGVAGLLFLIVAGVTLLVVAPARAAFFFDVTYTNNRINKVDADTGALLNSYAPPVVAQNGGGEGLAMSATLLYFASIDNVGIFALDPASGAVVNSFARPAASTGIDGLGYGTSTFG